MTRSPRGDERSRAGKMKQREFLAQARAGAARPCPAAVVLSGVASRAPADIALDLGIGDPFNAWVAGNITHNGLTGHPRRADHRHAARPQPGAVRPG